MRSIWTGSISFGLVNIPVKLYSAVSPKELTFDLLHKQDGSNIRFAKVCKKEEKEVPYDEVIKGFKLDDGNYVEVSEEDFAMANIKKSKSIEVVGFTKIEDFDPLYFSKPYYLEPDGSDKPFALLRDAMEKTGKVAYGSFVLRSKEHLVLLKPFGGVFLLNEMRFFSEIRSPKDLNIPQSKSDAREAALALSLIESLSKQFSIEDYQDTYSSDLRRLINKKVKGIKLVAGKPPRATEAEELMAQLKKSLAREKVKR